MEPIPPSVTLGEPPPQDASISLCAGNTFHLAVGPALRLGLPDDTPMETQVALLAQAQDGWCCAELAAEGYVRAHLTLWREGPNARRFPIFAFGPGRTDWPALTHALILDVEGSPLHAGGITATCKDVRVQSQRAMPWAGNQQTLATAASSRN